jgi:hypothetical protein
MARMRRIGDRRGYARVDHWQTEIATNGIPCAKDSSVVFRSVWACGLSEQSSAFDALREVGCLFSIVGIGYRLVLCSSLFKSYAVFL